MGYLSIRQTAEKWNLSARWISDLCKAGRIPGATKIGSVKTPPERPHTLDEFPEQRKSVHTGRFQRMRKSQLTQESRVVAT